MRSNISLFEYPSVKNKKKSLLEGNKNFKNFNELISKLYLPHKKKKINSGTNLRKINKVNSFLRKNYPSLMRISHKNIS